MSKEPRAMNGSAMQDHLTLIEQTRWRKCSDEMPDSDETVLIACPFSHEPVWFGYHDGNEWLTVEGESIDVTHWKPLPEPPESIGSKTKPA